MDIPQAIDLVQRTLIMSLLISAPMLVIGMVVGVVISILQAVTQIQEQTLSFVPKISAMILAAVFLLPWVTQKLLEYSHAMFLFGPLP
jgi:flagellar biosynthesis protein FliQ